jgi:inorganic pyrophosphatase
MPNSLSSLPAFADGNAVHVVIETPAGSRIKFKFESETGVFTMHKALAQGFVFPFPFGFVPGTRGADGDPIDVLLLTTLDPPLGTVAEATMIGALLVEQSEENKEAVRNDRCIAVPNIHHDDRQIETIQDLPPSELEDIERFFVQSGERDGKHLRILGRAKPEEALKTLRRSIVDPAQ